MEMEKVKNILSSIFFGCFGFCLSFIIAPLAAIAIICYMTKISFEVGYHGVESIDEEEKDMNKRLMEIDEDGE